MAVPAVAAFLVVCAAGGAEQAAPESAAYTNDFEQAEVGAKPPKELFVLDGKFTVQELDGNKVLELPGEPLDDFGLLFGPQEHATLAAGARIWGASSGRRSPEFGIGLGDVGGYKLWLMPAQNLLELRKGDEAVATAAYDKWASETWTAFRLRITKAGEGKWKVEGAAWPEDETMPETWLVSYDETEEPSPGRASLWANPYSDKPVRFDDLLVQPVTE